jgi:hypothetical protein
VRLSELDLWRMPHDLNAEQFLEQIPAPIKGVKLSKVMHEGKL